MWFHKKSLQLGNWAWTGFHNLELYWNVILWRAKQCFLAWIFCEFTDPSLCSSNMEFLDLASAVCLQIQNRQCDTLLVTDRDTSGLRPNRQPPIPVGDSIEYKCPQMKSIKGENSFSVMCNDQLGYTFPSNLQSWGECQCEKDLKAECPGLTYDIK